MLGKRRCFMLAHTNAMCRHDLSIPAVFVFLRTFKIVVMRLQDALLNFVKQVG